MHCCELSNSQAAETLVAMALENRCVGLLTQASNDVTQEPSITQAYARLHNPEATLAPPPAAPTGAA